MEDQYRACFPGMHESVRVEQCVRCRHRAGDDRAASREADAGRAPSTWSAFCAACARSGRPSLRSADGWLQFRPDPTLTRAVGCRRPDRAGRRHRPGDRASDDEAALVADRYEPERLRTGSSQAREYRRRARVPRHSRRGKPRQRIVLSCRPSGARRLRHADRFERLDWRGGAADGAALRRSRPCCSSGSPRCARWPMPPTASPWSTTTISRRVCGE